MTRLTDGDGEYPTNETGFRSEMSTHKVRQLTVPFYGTTGMDLYTIPEDIPAGARFRLEYDVAHQTDSLFITWRED